MNKFEIDFFEFSFLVEACIPPRPIARTMFFQRVSDEYYNIMTDVEKAKLFEWVQRSPNFDLDEEDCANFYARFNPDNQFEVVTSYMGKIEKKLTYFYKDQYHITKTASILEEYITEIKKV